MLACSDVQYPHEMRSARLEPELAPQEAFDLYLGLGDRIRTETHEPDSPALTWREAALLVNLIDAWRLHEQRKHIALKHALGRAQRRLVIRPRSAPPII
jgi:hypothetical protein